MTTSLVQRIRDWLGLTGSPTCPKDVHVRFVLKYGHTIVGYLDAEDGEWVFQYSDEFRKAENLRPITEFPDVNKVYRSTELWPFFLLRIPSPKQAHIQDIIKREDLDVSDDVKLLRRFGRRAVFNPYELTTDETLTAR